MKTRILFLIVLVAALCPGQITSVPAVGGTVTGTAAYSCEVAAPGASSKSCTHNLNTSQPWVVCYDASGNMLGSTEATTSITSVVANSANAATITFSGTTTGTCVVSSGSMGPTGATGPTGSAGAGFSGKGTYAQMGASSPTANDTWEVTDASVSGSCAAGSGTAKAICVYNGSSWKPPTPPHGFGATFDGGGAALSAPKTYYLTVPFACTITAWDIMVDTGTATFDLLHSATGTALPTTSLSKSTNGWSISSNNVIHSTTLSDFTSAEISANDLIGVQLKTVASATQVFVGVQCQ